MITLVQTVTINVTNVKVGQQTVFLVQDSENSLSTQKMILKTNVSVHPTIMREKMDFVMNVTLNVMNVQELPQIVMSVLMIESKIVNQTAHAQVINMKELMDSVKNVHSDVMNVLEQKILVMENVLMKPDSWMNAIVNQDIMKLTSKQNVYLVKHSVTLVLVLPTIVTTVP